MFGATLLLAGWVACAGEDAGPPPEFEIVSERESEPFPGVRIVEIETSAPQKVFAAFISLDEPSLRVDATEPTTRFVTVRDWAEENGALVAVNGDFMRYADGVPHLYGDAVGGGLRWPEVNTGRGGHYADGWFYRRYGWMAFGPYGVEFSATRYIKENRERFGAESGWRPEEVTSEIPEGTRALVSGFSQLVVEGKPIACEDPTAADCFPDRGDMRARHPRTAMGLSEDRRTFILVVVDGRSAESIGMYGVELAGLMSDLGAWTAINLDGGASSQMYVQGRGVINTPSAEPHRRVLNHWGVFPAD